LTEEERVKRWLDEQDGESDEILAGHLVLADAESRLRRTQRWRELRAIQAPYDSDWGWLVNGGSEAAWLYDEAARCFVSGYYLAALLCAHAACERALAATPLS
jgi:hypothetical protein